MIVKGYRKDAEGNAVLQDIFDIIECTYTGKDMGERSITATVTWASPIDFQIGDYIELQMQSLVRSSSGAHGDVEFVEKFYIYTMPTIKKTARAFEHGEGFEHTVTFYPAQHELACVQMRDMGNTLSADSIVYTGFDNVTFYGGAWELMERIMQVLKETYHDSEGNPLWSYEIADAVNEQKNTALERFPFSFSGNSVMDALLKLNDKEGINTTFFINGRTIYVGFKRPYFCRVTDSNEIDSQISTQMFSFKYGRTSDKSIAINHGGLCDITKSVGKELPITKLYAYGTSRNLNRYYCSDRLAPGRYVNRLMLPSFSIDGKTDYIISQDSMDRYGVREASKQFEDIYPSLRYMTYGDLRTIKYCIKIKASGLPGEITSHSYDVARVQCYKVVEGNNGVNTLVQAAPPDDLAIYVHTEGKVIRTVLYGGATDAEAIAKQKAHDVKVPTDGTNDIPGACFLVDDNGFGSSGSLSRDDWFSDPESGSYTEEQKTEIKLHQIKYTDTFWLTDLYIFHSYDQTYFNKDGYSAWSYPRLNSKYVSENGNIATDSTLVNTILGVEPVTIVDTNMTAAGLDKQQKTFDIYLGDVGFKIDEQNDFGENVFVIAGTIRVSMLDGLLAGREFEVNGSVVDSQSVCICAFNEDGSLNDEFFLGTDYSDSKVPTRAFDNGAIWRLRLNREYLDEPDYSNLNFAIPNTQINAKAGDHIVLLDIFMPDIYISAAENRLLHEAQKYLDANDNGSINYSFNFDPVRMLQIPTYALQMREGLNVRMEDGDLNIATQNKVKELFNGTILTNTSMYETVYNEVPTWYAYEHRGFEDIKDMLSFYTTVDGVEYIKNENITSFVIRTSSNGEWEGDFVVFINPADMEDGRDIVLKKDKITVRLVEVVRTVYGLERILTNNYITLDVTEYSVDKPYPYIRGKFKKNKSTPLQVDTYRYDNDYTYAFDGVAEYDLRSELQEEGIEYEPSTYLAPYGSLVYAPSKLLVEFKACKHYEISIEANKTALLKTDADGNPSFVLMNNLSGDALIFEPECSIEHTDLGNGFIRFVFDFDLDSSFNDSTLYYPTLVYVSDNQTEYIETRLVSIVESDLDGAIDLPYADFTIDSVTVKITDSSNRANAQPIKEISAVISEQHNATAWASLMNRVEETEKEGNQNTDAWKEVVQTARRHYQTLLNLRNSIFDPDGSCDQTFLQVMMLQVGADSMNYQLSNTRVGLNENGEAVFFNCSCEYNYDDSRYHFIVNGADELNHFVYVQGENKGKWEIPLGIDKTLDPNADGVYEPYFVCLRCPKDGSDATWLCETTQHKVNEDNTYWYFNWGILTVDSGGAYTLVETRGNAYMYGDNIICGKISTIARNSWFDLTKGEFVLGSDGEDGYALRYVDGVLTISGVNDSSVDSILSRLGLAETNINNISTKEEELTQGLANAIASISDLQSQIDGEVSSYFYPQAPVNSDDSVRIDIEPMSEWLLNYTLTNGVYVPNDDARNELINNLGDTYTNTEVSTPLAGKSWRWCDATNNDAITQYIVVRYTAGGVTTDRRLHWHIITDTDALRALEAAANAQSTADGKCTTFLEKPTEGYNVGDLWILEDDNIHPEGKKGDILTANVKRATYNESDWSKKVKYTDDSALANMVIGGRNILRNTKTMSEWTPFAYSDATLTKTTDGTTLINGNQATRIRTEGGSNRYKAIYGLLSMESIDFDKQYALSFNVTALDYSLCIFAKLSEAKGDNTFYKNEVIVPAGETKRVSFVGYPFTEQALQVWFGAAYYDADDATAAEYDANFLINELKLEIGSKATDWSPAPEDVDAAIDVAASQLEALKYLKEALTDGSSEITGGLIMTNVLMLKDLPEGTTEGVVTAGMSGISDDNILMWGGGTYAKALEQAQGLAESIYNMLPVLLTKTGINSRIGCLRIVSSTQVAIDGSDDTQIIIDGGDEDVSLRLIKGGVEKIHITSGVISAISTDTKTIALDYSYNEGSWKVLSNVNEGGKTVNLATIPLSSSNYAVSYNCNYLKVIIGVHLSNIGPQVSNVKIKFGVYIGNYCIGYANASVPSLQTSSIYTQLALYVRVNKSMSNLSGGTSYGILIKDVSVTCVYGGSTRNMNCVLISMALGTGGNSSDTWVEGGTITLTTSLTDKVTIASNGVQVESSTGLVQIMNGKGGAYIKMFGLPESDSDLDEDQLYRKTVSFEDFKESLKTTLAEQYFSVKSGVSNAVTQLANKLPDSFDTVGIK